MTQVVPSYDSQAPAVVEYRDDIRALDATRSSMPIPKGPVPTSMKGMRGNLRGR